MLIKEIYIKEVMLLIGILKNKVGNQIHLIKNN